MAQKSRGEEKGPPCLRCSHFRVTWEPQRPYACLHFGFKTAHVPALEVRRASGEPCRYFSPRQREARGAR